LARDVLRKVVRWILADVVLFADMGDAGSAIRTSGRSQPSEWEPDKVAIDTKPAAAVALRDAARPSSGDASAASPLCR
jgi:hypothetical protein